MSANITDQDAAIQDGVEVICDDCAEIINEFGQCNPHCIQMTGDVDPVDLISTSEYYDIH